MAKSPDAFRTISEVADWLNVPTHVLRFWESRFSQVKPVKRAGGRRYYRPTDMELLGGIKRLLHDDGLTIRGVQKLLREEGVRHVASLAPPLDGRPDQRGTGGDNVVSMTRKDADPEAALSRWPFVDDDPAPEPTPAESETDETTAAEAAAADYAAHTEADMPVPDDAQQETAAEAVTEAAPDTAAPAAEASERPPLSGPPLFDETAIYFAGPRVVAGLSRITPRQVRAHRDLFDQALDRGQALKRAMDRLDG
ncbi:MerR family transcriptional regulator [Palleronia pontilimi]|uniref:MerR family transcriptional regulator n=1 Tax=Palleronia pontilimi TaxID=1964209 RepID=UPI001F15C044|nr:MerR family transcriptional regulator [Palleronia pontilimi]